MAAPTATIIIPAYNEAQGIRQVLEKLIVAVRDCDIHILVIDDGSTDDTPQQVSQFAVEMIRQSSNRGYGAAIKTGLQATDSEFVVIMDADGQHNPQDVLRLLARTPEYDLVVGARTQVFHSPIWRMPGKWLLNLFANYIAKTKIPDSNSGLRAFRTEIVKKYLHLFPDGFSFSATSTLVLIRRGYRVAFEPVSVTSRLGNSSMSIRSGLDLLLTVLRLSILIDPLRVFLPSSLIMAGTGVLWGTRYVLIGSGVSVGSLMFILMGVLMFGLGLLADQISEMRQERFE